MDCALSLIRSGHSINRTTRLLRLSRPHVMAKLKRPSTWKDRRLACNRPEKKAGDEELVNDIKKALVEFPSFGYKRIAAIVNRARRKHQKDCVNRKKVYRVAKQNDLLLKKATPSLPGQSRDHNGKVSVDRSDERWCSDGFEFKCLNGESVTVTFVMDCCDREVISFVAKKGKGLPAWMAQEQVILAVNRRFGSVNNVPNKLQLLTDNGSAYTAQRTKRLLTALGIEDCKTAVCSPQSNGMAESMVKTLKRDYLPFIDLMSAETALIGLPAMIAKYNHEHPHSALNYLSPVEFRASKGLIDISPDECAEAPVCLMPGFMVNETAAGVMA